MARSFTRFTRDFCAGAKVSIGPTPFTLAVFKTPIGLHFSDGFSMGRIREAVWGKHSRERLIKAED
jgi:hypothetical protein